MTSVVIDASAIGPFVLADERDAMLPELDATLEKGRALVPAHWRLEVANMILIALRSGRIAPAHLSRILTQLRALVVEMDTKTNLEAWEASLELADKYMLTTYDAAYLELARRRRLPLATHDKALIRSAPAENVVLFGR